VAHVHARLGHLHVALVDLVLGRCDGSQFRLSRARVSLDLDVDVLGVEFVGGSLRLFDGAEERVSV
jgi:hypothetical protein